MKRSEAGERRLDQRNCEEAQHSRGKGRAGAGAGCGGKQGGGESEVNYLRPLCGMLGNEDAACWDAKAEQGAWGY